MARASKGPSIAALRVAAQRLGGARYGGLVEAVRGMGAMQGQDFAGVCWSLGARVEGATEASVREALAAGSIVRSWPMRGTLHLVPGEDLGWMLSLTAERTLKGAARRREQLSLGPAELARAASLTEAALREGKSKTRERLLALLSEGGVSTDDQRGYHLLWNMAHEGLICFGPPEGAEQTFVLLGEWIKEPARLGRSEALAELALRYFTGHGPATLRDFVWWSSLTTREARQGVEACGGRLERLEHGEISYFHAPGLRDEAPPEALLLPGFDELLLGYQERSAVLAAEHAGRIVPGGNGVFLPTVVVRGQVAGTWKRAARSRHIAVTIEPFSPLSGKARKAIEEAASGYQEFIGRPVEVGFAP